MIRIATVNVNGLRAALRKGMREWLTEARPDVLSLQEVRAPDEIVRAEFDGWYGVHAEAAQKGRAGVALFSRHEPLAVRSGLGDPYFQDAGRWVELDLELADGRLLTVVSSYVHSGGAGTPKQEEKYRFLAAVESRLQQLAAGEREVLLTGDMNICHREQDLRNWKNNLKRAGFLPEERAWLDSLFGPHGFVDVQRAFEGERDGPYSWWSQRGKAFDNDAGWRIDYHIATPGLAGLARNVATHRAASWDSRWSDHAPVVADYGPGLARQLP